MGMNPADKINLVEMYADMKVRAGIAEDKLKTIHRILDSKFNISPSSLTGEENAIFKMTYL